MKPEFIAIFAALIAVFAGSMTALVAIRAKRHRGPAAAATTDHNAQQD